MTPFYARHPRGHGWLRDVGLDVRFLGEGRPARAEEPERDHEPEPEFRGHETQFLPDERR